MIAQIKGTIAALGKNLVVDVNGVGYEIAVVPALILEMRVGAAVTLHTFLNVREDALELYGFLSVRELAFFKQLISVSGVGPKSALNICGLGKVEEIQNAIARGDLIFLTKVSGIGRKTAERIVVELKDKLALVGGASDSDADGRSASGVLGEVADVLIGMGYSEVEARNAVKDLPRDGEVGELLKMALRRRRIENRE